MSCVIVKSNVVEIGSTLNFLAVGIRDPLSCECGPPVRDIANAPGPVYTMEISRKGKTTLVGTFPRMPTTRADGNTEFLIDPSFFAQPAGLYTATIKRTLNGQSVIVDPSFTLWLRPPHRHDGVFSTLPGATSTDENPS